MAVEKFRTFEDARRGLWAESGDVRLLERMKKLGELARVPRRPPGVTRFRSIEEAKAHRLRATR